MSGAATGLRRATPGWKKARWGHRVRRLFALIALALSAMPSLAAESWPTTRFQAFVGEPFEMSWTVTNRGAVTTTYALTTTLPSGGEAFSATLSPAATEDFTVALTPTVLGYYSLQAEVVACI